MIRSVAAQVPPARRGRGQPRTTSDGVRAGSTGEPAVPVSYRSEHRRWAGEIDVYDAMQEAIDTGVPYEGIHLNEV